MKKMMKGAALGLVALATFAAQPAAAKEYLLTGLKPDKLALVDMKARKVERLYTIPDAGSGPLTVVPSPDGNRAYALTNHMNSATGIDLNTGEEVFRANFSTEDTRIRAVFAMEISPDGKELYVFQSPVKLLPGEYQVQDTYIAVYNTADGLDAKPVRTFPAPRRTALLSSSTDGKKLYAIGWDITAFDPKTGEVLEVLGVRNWGRENYSEPDVLDVWPQWEQASMFSTPYYALRTDMSMEDPDAWKTGMLTLDLDTGQMVQRDFESTAAIIFSTVINPMRQNEAYGVYTQLSKIDVDKGELVKRIELDHTYYAVNVSSDGTELYAGGTMDDIAIYDTETLEKKGEVRFEGGEDMGIASLRIIHRN